jgi:prepilin-type N-terminal cleavage/methylation domain-containing protein
MSAGKREMSRTQGISNYLRESPFKRNGFSLLEPLIVSLIISIILGGLFITLNIGQFSFPVSSRKLELQAEARLAMNWIMKDLRQAISWNIASIGNSPSTTHLKFNLWVWNTTINAWDVSATDYIEYEYDAILKKLSRKINVAGNLATLDFNNIIEPPFYTTYIAEGAPGNALDLNALLTNKKLIIVITGQKIVRGALNLTFTLKSEAKIRNG